jgi:hypothetical protein
LIKKETDFTETTPFAEVGLSQRALELADDADIRVTAPRKKVPSETEKERYCRDGKNATEPAFFLLKWRSCGTRMSGQFREINLRLPIVPAEDGPLRVIQ